MGADPPAGGPSNGKGLLSMTGHGRASLRSGASRVAVDCSTVNRKGLEVAVQAPRELFAIEPLLREEAAGCIRRGRLNIAISITASGIAPSGDIPISSARSALRNLRAIADELGLPGEISLDTLLRHPAMQQAALSAAPLPGEEIVLDCFHRAMEELVRMRKREGRRLEREIRRHLAELSKLVKSIATLAPKAVEAHRKALRERVEKSVEKGAIDPSRLAQEVVMFADRCDITEELARMRSHLAQFAHSLGAGESPGRTLEFLAQEMGRELNTAGAKSNCAEISQHVVLAKSVLEKIREQLANIE